MDPEKNNMCLLKSLKYAIIMKKEELKGGIQ